MSTPSSGCVACNYFLCTYLISYCLLTHLRTHTHTHTDLHIIQYTIKQYQEYMSEVEANEVVGFGSL